MRGKRAPEPGELVYLLDARGRGCVGTVDQVHGWYGEVMGLLSGPQARAEETPSPEAPAVAAAGAGPTARPARRGEINVSFNRAVQRALELAVAEGLRAERRVIDPGDVLIGLAEGGDELTARALAELGVDADALRAALERARRGD